MSTRRFAIFPFELLSRVPRSLSVVMVLLVLLSHRNARNERCDPAIQTISRESGFPARTVKRALKKLDDAQIIRIERRPGRVNQYFIPAAGVAHATGVMRATPTSDIAGRNRCQDAPKTRVTDATLTDKEQNLTDLIHSKNRRNETGDLCSRLTKVGIPPGSALRLVTMNRKLAAEFSEIDPADYASIPELRSLVAKQMADLVLQEVA